MRTYQIKGRDIRKITGETLTSGSVGVEIRMSFDESWSGLMKTVCFRAEDPRKPGQCVQRDVVLEGDTVVIPPEVLERACRLYVGVYGLTEESATPTIWASPEQILPGAVPGDAPPLEPGDPSLHETLLTGIGNLNDLVTADKSSIVAAVNEVARSGGGGGVSFTTDETLSLKDGVLSVNTAGAVEADNTLPVTAAAVQTTVGNIEILLATI